MTENDTQYRATYFSNDGGLVLGEIEVPGRTGDGAGLAWRWKEEMDVVDALVVAKMGRQSVIIVVLKAGRSLTSLFIAARIVKVKYYYLTHSSRDISMVCVSAAS